MNSYLCIAPNFKLGLMAYILLGSLLCGAQGPGANDKARTATGAPLDRAAFRKGADVPISVSTPEAKPHDDAFIIGADDVLAVNVWKEPEISRSVPVRSDGRISLPLVGEVQASGQTPRKLEQEIASKLKNYVSEADVTVIVTEIKSQSFNILGQVNRPGSYSLVKSVTVLDAIALAGGFRDFAKQKSIYILRQNFGGGESRIPFNYKAVIKGGNPAQNINLQPRDTVVVP